MGARWLHTRSAAARLASPADWLLAGGLFAAFEFIDGNSRYNPLRAPTPPHVLWALAGAVMTLSLAARRRHPLGVWLVSSAGAAFLLSFIGDLDPFAQMTGWASSPLVVLPAPLVALYTLAGTSPRRGRRALAGSVIGLGLLITGPVPMWRPVHVYELGLPGSGLTLAHYEDPKLLILVGTAALITAWALGETVRARGESSSARLAAAEAEKAEHDRAVAAEERARIAREIHDITAHHISVVTLQAGAARLLAESGRVPSAELLRGIESAGRQAMTEIRQALGVIRSSPDGAAPLPGLSRLQELTAQMGLAGLAVSVQGRGGALPGGLDLTAYRVVQEGLANVARHSAAQTALVGFCRASGTLEISVADDGPARPGSAAGAPGGHGLIGLRERVARYGGELMAGPRLGGGFLLRATLPVHDIADGLLDPALAQHHDGRDDAGQITAALGSATAAP